jgi:hypothetical protein
MPAAETSAANGKIATNTGCPLIGSFSTRRTTRKFIAVVPVMLLRPVNPLVQFVMCYNVRKQQSEIR